MAQSPFAIETRGLRKRFTASAGDLVAVDGLDLQVRHGEIFGLLGPNGAGKTTTIGMLTTRVIPTEGQALVDGVDVARHPSAVKRRIGVVSQHNTLDRSLTVRENLSFHGRYFGLRGREANRRADEYLERFRLGDRRDAQVMALSGGMAQRLMVARALLHRPSVLFLDEPTTGLDPQSRLALWEVLRELHAEGQTILLTTHYMEEADQLCDRLAVMDHGRILALGTPGELKRDVDPELVREQIRARIAEAAPDGPTLEMVFIALTGRELRE
jgi:ABC-2 type transport system ATP-binding protein